MGIRLWMPPNPMYRLPIAILDFGQLGDDCIRPRPSFPIALSEALEVPLVTSDIKLAGVPGHRAVIESHARSI